MSPTTRLVTVQTLCIVIALATLATAGAGVFARGSGKVMPFVTIRSELDDYTTDGVYAFNARRVVAEGIGWDVVTLFVIAPALLVTVFMLRRGTLRIRLFTMGLLGYLFYQYLMYAVTWSFGPLFLPFVLIYALSLVTIVLIAAELAAWPMQAAFGPSFPHRGMAVFSAVMAALLTLMWLARIWKGTFDSPEGVLFGQQTLTVQALDLGLVVPLSVFTAVLAWRRTVAGSILSAVFIIKSIGMCSAICGMLLSAWFVEGMFETEPFVIFLVASVISVVLAIRMYSAVSSPFTPTPG